jgi:Helix-turn-helix domain
VLERKAGAMSIRLMAQVWEDTRVESQAELLVLLALADHARDDGLCWPSMRTIAKKARLEERSAQRIVRRLIEKELIELVSKGGCIEGHNTPNHYRVMVSESKQSSARSYGQPGVTVSRGVGGDRRTPRGDVEDTSGVTHGHPNHHIEPSMKRITTTTYGEPERELSHPRKPMESSSSRRCSGSVLCDKSAELATPADQLIAALGEEFGLAAKQRRMVATYFESHGEEYIRCKAIIVRSEPRKNAAGALLAALRDDWQVRVPVGRTPEDDPKHLATSEELAHRMGWQW